MRSNSIKDIGTIVRKKFPDKWREGKVTSHNSVNQVYTILYNDGETDEYDSNKMRKYYKTHQHYSAKKHDKKPSRARALFSEPKYDTNFHYCLLPCAKAPQSIPIDTFKHYAMAAAGKVWDPELNKMASYRDLINHPNKAICELWTGSGENEYGRLFDG